MYTEPSKPGTLDVANFGPVALLLAAFTVLWNQTNGYGDGIRTCAVLSAFVLMASLTWFNGKPEAAGLIQGPWDKLVHFGLFFVLAGLMSSGFGRRQVWIAAGLTLAYALFDEFRQTYLPGRHADLLDFSVDLLGIACGLLIGVGLNRWLSAP